MKAIYPKCSIDDSFKYSILISLHYYELNVHKERINRLNKYINNYKFNSDNYDTFENNNPSISLSVYDEYGKLLQKSFNNSSKKAYMIKINNHRHHALKPVKDKYKQLEELLKQFTHKELTAYILSDILISLFNTTLLIFFIWF